MSTSPLFPVVLAACAAFLFGISVILTKRGLAHGDAQTGSMISIITAMLWYLLFSPWWMVASEWFTPGFWVFVINGLIHPLLSMTFSFEATRRTGPTISATLAATAPVFAALGAVTFLGERPGILVLWGTAGTIAGVLALSWQRNGGHSHGPIGMALLFATAAAVIRGLNHTVGKWGLAMLPNVFMAGFLSFLVSSVGSVLVYRVRVGTLPRNVPPAALGYFALTGTCAAAAIVCMYGALALGDVVAVSPIVAAYPLFTMLAALLFRQESLNVRHVLGVLLVVAGGALISLGMLK